MFGYVSLENMKKEDFNQFLEKDKGFWFNKFLNEFNNKELEFISGVIDGVVREIENNEDKSPFDVVTDIQKDIMEAMLKS